MAFGRATPACVRACVGAGLRHVDLVLGVLDLVVVSIVRRTTSHLCPALPVVRRPVTDLAFSLQ